MSQKYCINKTNWSHKHFGYDIEREEKRAAMKPIAIFIVFRGHYVPLAFCWFAPLCD